MRRNPIQAYEEALVRLAPKNFSFRSAAARLGVPYTFASMDEYANMIKDLYNKVRKEFQPDIVIGILQGGFYSAYTLSEMFDCDLDYAGASANFLRDVIILRHFTYRRDRKTGKITPKLSHLPVTELKGRKVLIVDDEATSGNTMKLIKAVVESQNPSEVRTAALINYKKKNTDYFSKFFSFVPRMNLNYINLPSRRYSPFFKEYAQKIDELFTLHPEL
jgi:hypoxanthine phosphoribosyltransferase